MPGRIPLALGVALALASGCLYLGGINRPPEGSFVGDPPESLLPSSPFSLAATGHDPDGDRLEYTWVVWVTPKGAAPYRLAEDRYHIYKRDDRETLELTLPQDEPAYGMEVRCTIGDPQGARVELSKVFSVENQPPTAVLTLLGEQLQDGRYARELPLVVSAAKSEDEAGDLLCGRGQVSWRVHTANRADVVIEDVIACTGDQVLDKLRLGVRPGSEPISLTVEATVKDRWGATQVATRRIVFAPDRPPCVQASVPSYQPVAPAVVARLAQFGSQSLTLGIRDSWPLPPERQGYRWSMAPTLAGPYRAVANQSESTLLLPAGTVKAGRRLFVRVRALGDQEVTCPAADALCPSAVEGAPAGCQRWVTWEVVGR